MNEFLQRHATLLTDVAIVAFITACFTWVAWVIFAVIRDIGKAFSWVCGLLWQVPRMFFRAVLRLFAVTIEEETPEPQAPEAAPLEATSQGGTLGNGVPLTLDAQWQRLAAVILRGVVRAQNARRLQETAARKVDAAGYAVTQIMAEMNSVAAIGKAPEDPATELRHAASVLAGGTAQAEAEKTEKKGRRALAA